LQQTSEGGYPETVIELDGSIDAAVAEALEDKIWAHMNNHAHLRPPRLGEFEDARGEGNISYSLALAQLLIARRVVLIENELLEMVP
jgi:hypothetical protein